MSDLNSWTAVRHEVLHALAYVAQGEEFKYLDVNEWMVARAWGPLDEDIRANVCMAGPVAEMHGNMARIGTEVGGIDAVISGWPDEVQALLDDGELPIEDDFMCAFPHLSNGLHWAWAFALVNSSLVDRLAIVAQERGRLSFDDFTSLVDRIDSVTADRLDDARGTLAPWSARIEETETLLARLYRQRGLA